MPKRPEKAQKSQAKLQGFVIVTITEDLEQAKNYETLLKANNIPTIIKEQAESQPADIKGIAIMVPEDFLDEAHVVIKSQDAYDDFYNFTSEDDYDFDSDLFEDDF